ncbi:MAG: glycosyltransferase, partial [Gammaproteobacteria bacterium]
AAMKAGFDHARGDVVVSMDGDLQNDPRDIPTLIAKLEEGFDLVAGYREDRKDAALTRRFPSWTANQLLRALTGVRIRDTGCSLRAYRASVTRRIQLYSDLHRFLPAVAVATCGARVTEVPVRHHPRRHGTSKYSLGRVWRVLADLLALTMILTFREQPLRMFGLLAFVCFEMTIVAAAMSAMVMTTFTGGDHLAFVFPAVTILLFGLSVHLVMLGFIGEVVVRLYWLEANPMANTRGALP